MDLSEFTAENLSPHVGSTFKVDVNGQTFDLELTEVKVLMEKHISPRMKRDSFSLFFLAPENFNIRQGPYPMTHEKLGGPWAIFIVPIGRKDSNRLEYEAVFT